MDNLVKTMINQMARRTGTRLTSRHHQILEFANEYYYKNQVGPMYHVLQQKLGLTRAELETLFPNGLYSVYSWIGIPIQSPRQICKPIAQIKPKSFRQVYFDHAGTTYLRPEVEKVMQEYYRGDLGFGNPSSSTFLGKKAYEALHDARVQIASSLKVSPEEIYFTSGGTEANNLAIKGLALQHLDKKGHILASKIEHASVLGCLKWLQSIGFEIELLDVDSTGLINPDQVKGAIRKDTLLVCIMAANNEIGTINPLHEIAQTCQNEGVPLLSDAAQAYGKYAIRPKTSGISMVSFTGHKIYASKGVGALFIDHSLKLSPLLHGGDQEMGLRAGTENVGCILGFGRAAALAQAEMESEKNKMTLLRDLFLKKLEEHVKDYIINGSLEQRLSNNLNIGFPHVDSGALLLSLNHIGVFVSSGSACHAGSRENSHVIKALGVDDRKYGSIRFSFGLSNTKEDIEYLFEYLGEILRQLKNER